MGRVLPGSSQPGTGTHLCTAPRRDLVGHGCSRLLLPPVACTPAQGPYLALQGLTLEQPRWRSRPPAFFSTSGLPRPPGHWRLRWLFVYLLWALKSPLAACITRARDRSQRRGNGALSL